MCSAQHPIYTRVGREPLCRVRRAYALFLCPLSHPLLCLHLSFQGTSSTSLWMRNIQLGSFGIFIGLCTVVLKDGAAVASRGFFADYNPMVWLCISLNSLGGLAVAMVVKYADNLVSCCALLSRSTLSRIPVYVRQLFPAFTWFSWAMLPPCEMCTVTVACCGPSIASSSKYRLERRKFIEDDKRQWATRQHGSS